MERDKYIDQKISVTVDCIIFGFDGTELKVLLIKRTTEPRVGKLSLLGGYLNNNESADAAAHRILLRYTGMEKIYLEQFHTFSDITSDSGGRCVIAIAYFAVIKIDDCRHSREAEFTFEWFPMDKLPDLLPHHKVMIEKARVQLKNKTIERHVGLEMLPAKFTIPQLRALYESILNHRMDQRNFAKKIMRIGLLTRLSEKEKHSSKKGAFYYTFDKDRYRQVPSSALRFLYREADSDLR